MASPRPPRAMPRLRLRRLAPLALPPLLLFIALCPIRTRAATPPPSPSSAPGAAFHAARAALLAQKLGRQDAVAETANAANAANAPLVSAVGERDRLQDDAHPPAAAIRHPSFNASSPSDPAATARRAQFVRRAPAGNGSGGLHLGDGPVPWVAVGLSWPDAVLAAVEERDEGDNTNSSSKSRRPQLSRLLSRLSKTGFNALRVLALPQGAQPWPGALSAKHLDALDWLVAEARAHGLRLLLVLADGGAPLSSLRSGAAIPPPPSHAREYTAWVDADATLRDGFFGNDTVKSVFLDAAAAIVGRRNPRVDNLAYRHDPTVLGWELLAGAHPGCCCGGDCGNNDNNNNNDTDANDNNDPAAPLRGWARQVAGFLRKKDPHHLIALGGDGLLGASSPHLAAVHNPAEQPLRIEAALCGRACAAATVINSTTRVSLAHDWHDLTSSVPDLDLAVAAVSPWRWGVGVGGGEEDEGGCRLGAWGRGANAEDDGSGGVCLSASERGGGLKKRSDATAAWARGWVRAHQRDSLRLQRPLLLTVEVSGGGGGGGDDGAKGGNPMSMLEAVAADLVRAVDERRAPSAGVFVSVVGQRGGGGWRDGRGAAAVLRAVAAADEEEGEGQEELGALLSLGLESDLSARPEDGDGGGAEGWRRFYHGGQEEEEDGGSNDGDDDAHDEGASDADDKGALDASARDVLRVVGRLGQWQRRREEAAVVVRS